MLLIHGIPGHERRDPAEKDPAMWPYSSRYFNLNLMNAQDALDLLVHDAFFDDDESEVEFLDVDAGTVGTSTIPITGYQFRHAATLSDLSNGGVRVFFVPIRRYWSFRGIFARYYFD